MRNHIRKKMQGTQWVAWCGQVLWSHDWVFQSIDHAILSEQKLSTGGPPCLKCLEAARTAIANVWNAQQ